MGWFKKTWEWAGHISLAKDLAVLLAGPTLVSGAVGAVVGIGTSVLNGAGPLLIALMAVLFALLFMIGWILALEVMRRIKRPAKSQKTLPKRVSLLTLYATDHLQGTNSAIQAYMRVGREGDDAWEVQFHVQVICQYDSNAKYLAIYIPEVDDPEKILFACAVVAKELADFVDQKSINLAMRRRGGNAATRSAEIPFTGRINIYHETFLIPEQVARIEALFRERSATAHFFDRDYASTVSDNIKAGIAKPRAEHIWLDGAVLEMGEAPSILATDGVSFELSPGEGFSLRLPPNENKIEGKL